MTTISGTSSTAALQSLQSLQAQRPQGPQDGGPLGAAAKALGVSQNDLMSELSSGKSLSDIADEKGVSQDDLASAIKSSLPQQVQGADDVDSIVASIMTQQGPPPPPPGGARGFGQPDTSVSGVLGDSLTSAQQDMLDSLSSLLGTDSGSLLDQLQSGTSLTDLLSSSGATTDQLASILENGLLVDTQA